MYFSIQKSDRVVAGMKMSSSVKSSCSCLLVIQRWYPSLRCCFGVEFEFDEVSKIGFTLLGTFIFLAIAMTD